MNVPGHNTAGGRKEHGRYVVFCECGFATPPCNSRHNALLAHRGHARAKLHEGETGNPQRAEKTG